MKSKQQLTQINEQIKPNETKHVDTEKRVVVTRGERSGGGEMGKRGSTVW